MKKILITGGNGTIGKEMIFFLKNLDFEVILWDRNIISPFHFQEIKEYIQATKPDFIFHFAMASNEIENETWAINHDWSRDLAIISNEFKIQYLFTSSALVFSNDAIGPFTKQSIPDAKSGYGFEKLKAEQSVLEFNKNAYIIRLGWQIGKEYEGNNMLAHFEREQIKNGKVIASSKWKPACSFLSDTVKEIYRIISEEKPNIYMIDANDKFSFFEIATYLNKLNGKRWKIEESDSYIFDQRMIDSNSKLQKLSEKVFFQ